MTATGLEVSWMSELLNGRGMEVEGDSADSMSDAAVVEVLESDAGVAHVGVGLEMRCHFDGVSSCGTSVAVRLTGEWGMGMGSAAVMVMVSGSVNSSFFSTTSDFTFRRMLL